MCAKHLLPENSQYFKVTARPRTSVVWVLNDFSKINVKPGDYLESPKFGFLYASWSLRLYLSGRDESTADEAHLCLCRDAYFVELQEIRYRLVFGALFETDCISSEYVHKFEKYSNCGPECRTKRKNLENGGESGEFLQSHDVLVLCCKLTLEEMQEAGPTDNEDTGESLKLFEDLKAVYEEELCPDVILNVGDEAFPAHKAILSSRSPVFRGMFVADMKENREHVVDIREMEAQTAREFLRYIYTGKVCDLEDESARSLYLAADRYDVEGLKLRCQQYFLNNISVDNVCQLALLSDFLSDEELKSAVREFLRKNHHNVLQSAIWKEAASEEPAFFWQLISSVFMEVSDALKVLPSQE